MSVRRIVIFIISISLISWVLLEGSEAFLLSQEPYVISPSQTSGAQLPIGEVNNQPLLPGATNILSIAELTQKPLEELAGIYLSIDNADQVSTWLNNWNVFNKGIFGDAWDTIDIKNKQEELAFYIHLKPVVEELFPELTTQSKKDEKVKEFTSWIKGGLSGGDLYEIDELEKLYTRLATTRSPEFSISQAFTQDALNGIINTHTYNSGEDTLTINPQDGRLSAVGDDQVRIEGDKRWYEVSSKTNASAFVPELWDLSRLNTINFNVTLTTGQGEEFRPLLMVRLEDSAGKIAVARVNFDSATTGAVSLGKEQFDTAEGFKWTEVGNIKFGFEYNIPRTSTSGFVSKISGDKVEILGFNLEFIALTEVSFAEESREREFFKNLIIKEWFGGILRDTDQGTLDKNLDLLLSRTTGGLVDGGESIFTVAAEVVSRGKNLRFLAEKENRLIKAIGSLQLSSSGDINVLESFEQKLSDEIKQKYPGEAETVSAPVLMLGLSEAEQLKIRQKVWGQLIKEEEKSRPANPEAQYLTDYIKPLLESYLGVEDLGQGSYFYNALYWLGSAWNEVTRFSREENTKIDEEAEKRIEKLKENSGITEISSQTRERVRKDVEIDFALRKAYNEMFYAGLDVTIDYFIKWVTKDLTDTELSNCRENLKLSGRTDSEIDTILKQRYTMTQIQGIEQTIKATSAIIPSVEGLLGLPSTDYLQRIETEQIGDRKFMELQLKAIADVLVDELYLEIGADKAILLDAKGGIHANVAATGMGIELIATLTQAGIIERQKGLDMCTKLMNSILYIQQQQPKGDWIDGLFAKYPFVFVEKLAGRSETDLRDSKVLNTAIDDLISEVSIGGDGGSAATNKLEALRDSLREYNNSKLLTDVIDPLVSEGLISVAKAAELKGKIKGVGVSSIDSLVSEGLISVAKAEELKTSIEHGWDLLALSPEDIAYLQTPDLTKQLDLIDKYGWGGWLYHFTNTADLSRPTDYVEISPADTLEYFFYAVYATSVFPELEGIFKESFSMVDADNPQLYRNDGKSYRLHWVTDLNRPGDYKGLAPDAYFYEGAERRIIDYTRVLCKVIRGESVSSSDFYPDKKINKLDEVGMEVPITKTFQFAGWTVGWFGINVGWNMGEGSKDYSLYREMQEAYYALHMLAMQNSDYGLYQSGPDQMETQKSGFQMGDGQPGGNDIKRPNEAGLATQSNPSNDGTYSVYSLGNNNPVLGTEGAIHDYMTNPRSYQDSFLPYDSHNEAKGFWSPTVYLLNLGYYGLGLVNRYEDGKVWKTYNGIDIVQAANTAVGLHPINGYIDFDPEPEYVRLIEGLEAGSISYNTSQDAIGAAESLVSYTVELAYDAATRRDELGFNIYEAYLDYNDRAYKEADKMLESAVGNSSGEDLVKAMALRFVINKNQNYYLSQREIFAELAKLVQGNDAYFEIATRIISQYDYEARGVIYKGYDLAKVAEGEDPRKGLIPVLSAEEIRGDLTNFPNPGKTWTDPELENYLATNQNVYPLIAEEAGVLMPLYEGVTTEKGEFSKGLKQLIETWGWETAINIMRTKFNIQSAIKPYVELVTGSAIKLNDSSGKPYGILVGWQNEVLERLKDVRALWPNSTNPVSLDRVLEATVSEGRQDQINEAVEFVINELKLAARFKMFLERITGRTLDLVFNKEDKELFDKEFDPIRKDLEERANGRALSESLSNGQDNSEGDLLTNLMGMGTKHPVNFLITDRLISAEQIAQGPNGTLAMKAIYNPQEGGFAIPLMFGDFSKANWLEFMVSAPAGETVSFKIIIRTTDGKEAVFPIENVTDSWRALRIPIYGPYKTDWMSDTERENWTWISDELWKGYMQGTLSEDLGGYIDGTRGERNIIEGNEWYWRKVMQAITGAEPSANALEIQGTGDTTYTLNNGHNIYEVVDEISETGNWDNISEIRFEFEPGVEFYISGVNYGNQQYTGFYNVVGSGWVYEKFEDLVGDYPSVRRPALVTTKDGGSLIVLEARTDYVKVIDPSYGTVVRQISAAEFKELWDSEEEVLWLRD